MKRFVLFIFLMVGLTFSLTERSKADYYTISYKCENHSEFLNSKEITYDKLKFRAFFPYIISSLNLYGRLEGRKLEKTGPFEYKDEWGHYFNKPLLLLKPEPIPGSKDFEIKDDDRCPSSELRYLRSIFSDKDNLHISLLVIDKKIEAKGPGKKLFDAILGIVIKASTNGILDINQDIINFIQVSKDEINLLGHAIGDIYNPKNSIPKRNLKTVPLDPDLGSYTIDDGTLFDIPLTITKIDTMSDVSSVRKDQGTIFENVKEYMHIDAHTVLKKFFDAKLSPKLFQKPWTEFKEKSNSDLLANRCGSLRERIESDLSVLTRSDRTIALSEFVNEMGLENPHLKKFCMGNKWYSAAKASDFRKSFDLELKSSKDNPFSSTSAAATPKPTPGKDRNSLKEVWLEKKNVQTRLNWIIESLKLATSAGDGAVNNIANAAKRYAAAPIKFRDTTGAFRDNVFETEVAIADLMYIVSSASKKKGQKIDVLGCYLNYRQLNEVKITDEDWHWQIFGKWENKELNEADYFLVRVKFENTKRSADKGANFSSISFLNISETSLFNITNKHKKSGVSLKKTTCGSSKHPIGSVYAQLY